MSPADTTFIQEEEPVRPEDRATRLSDEERDQIEGDRLRAQIDDLIQDRQQRKTYATRLFWLVVGWFGVVGLIVGLHGFRFWSFELPVAALATLVGSTTVSLVGLFAVVARYLFPQR